MEKFNFAFWGTPKLSAQTLDILKKSGYIPTVIITTPPQKSGRGLEIKESPVSLWANKHNILCLKPEKIDNIFFNTLSVYNLDLNVVVAYGKILPESIINQPKLGTVNIHYSLLPKYRGASPLESALLNGDEITGVSIQQMVFKLDTGSILDKEKIEINKNDTKDDLRDKLVDLGGNLLSRIIPKIINKSINPLIQNEDEATYCKKIKKEDGEIDPSADAKENFNKYRAFYGWPGIYFFTNRHSKKIRIKITQAIYEDNKFIIKKVIPEGKKEIDYDIFMKQN